MRFKWSLNLFVSFLHLAMRIFYSLRCAAFLLDSTLSSHPVQVFANDNMRRLADSSFKSQVSRHDIRGVFHRRKIWSIKTTHSAIILYLNVKSCLRELDRLGKSSVEHFNEDIHFRSKCNLKRFLVRTVKRIKQKMKGKKWQTRVLSVSHHLSICKFSRVFQR